MQTQYRLIKVTPLSTTTSVNSNVADAYTQCIPKDARKVCRMMLPAVINKFKDGESLVRVTCVNSCTPEFYWIEKITDPNAPLPDLTIENRATLCQCLAD